MLLSKCVLSSVHKRKIRSRGEVSDIMQHEKNNNFYGVLRLKELNKYVKKNTCIETKTNKTRKPDKNQIINFQSCFHVVSLPVCTSSCIQSWKYLL